MAGSIEPSHPAINLSFAELGAAESELITVRTESERYHFAIKGTK
jgi:hypothetical protein